jgi:hypothetical protein
MGSMIVELCDGEEHVIEEIVKFLERILPLLPVGAFHYPKIISFHI